MSSASLNAAREKAREVYAKIHRQVTSPWTKLVLLACLTLLVTRRDISFNVTLGGGGGFFGLAEPSVFAGLPAQDVGEPAGAVVDEDEQARLQAAALRTKMAAPRREWTAKQKRQLAYVDQYAAAALAEMRTHGIPASITLAQGLLESGTGRSTLARKNHNHFGIKCFSKKCPKGHCSNHSDDHHKDFFRIFQAPEESFHAHSQVLLKDRYKPLFQLKITDYKKWAHGLRKAGYATDPRYGDKLIRLIEELELWRYDRL